MSVTHVSAARNAAANAVVGLLDVGSTNASAHIVIETSGAAALATLVMTNPSFGAASAGVATAAAITSATATGAGTAALAIFQDRSAAEVFRCAVAASGSDINMSSTTIAVSDTVAISSLTYTAAP